MHASDIAYSAQAAHGWTDATLLDVVLEYVDRQDAGDAFADHLRDAEYDERTYCEWCRAMTSEGPDGPDLCGACIDGQHVTAHELTLEPDKPYPHLSRAHCACGWHSAGYVRPELASTMHARHAITAPE